jgi:hypothetical protein
VIFGSNAGGSYGVRLVDPGAAEPGPGTLVIPNAHQAWFY